MKRGFLLGVVIFVSFALGTRSNASPAVTLEVERVPLQEAIVVLFKRAGENFVLGPDLPQDRNITLNLKDVPLEQALKQICDECGLVWRKEDNVYVICQRVTVRPSSAASRIAGSTTRRSFAPRARALSMPQLSYQGAYALGGTTKGRPAANFTMRLSLPQSELEKFTTTYLKLSDLTKAADQNNRSNILSQLRSFSSPTSKGKMHFVPNVSFGDFDNDGMLDLFYSGTTEQRSVFQCPHCKKSATVVGRSRICGKCNRVFDRDWKYCPFDGTKKTTPLDDWKVCPFCGKKVASAATSARSPASEGSMFFFSGTAG